MIFLRLTAWLLAPIAIVLASSEHTAAGPSDVDFNRDIRPILSETCYQCHGPDHNKLKADLRLDTRAGLFRSAEGSTVVVPGKPDESELLIRLTAEDDETRMPPPKASKRLTPGQIDRIRRWIQQGAVWKGHWAYIPPSRPYTSDLPRADDPIDRFLLARMNGEGLEPSPEADRSTLIRRLSLDLLGLPPTPKEVDAFVHDTRPDAYEHLVDRLLASPHYGERMAIFWLDLVRFADTQGYHSDNHMDIWPFRDYVIRSFNANKPFDQLTIEHLAGDLIPSPTDESRIASGYNRLLQTTQEGGAQAKEYIAKYAADRVRNVSTVWLGATLGCAECHDHKFDPFTTREFYSLAAFFADVKETIIARRSPLGFHVRGSRPTCSRWRSAGRFLRRSRAHHQTRRRNLPTWTARSPSWWARSRPRSSRRRSLPGRCTCSREATGWTTRVRSCYPTCRHPCPRWGSRTAAHPGSTWHAGSSRDATRWSPASW